MCTRNNKQPEPLGQKSQGPAMPGLTYHDPPHIEAMLGLSEPACSFCGWYRGEGARLRL